MSTGIYFLRIDAHLHAGIRDRERQSVCVTQGRMGALSSFILIAVVPAMSVTLKTAAEGWQRGALL